MKIIKLSATASTNSFLKEMAQSHQLTNYTVIVAKEQTNGRGQMTNSWHSEKDKSLTFSIFTTLKNLNLDQRPYLSFAVSLAIYDVLNQLDYLKIAIKWPNDIMAGNKKICGILLESTLANQQIKNTIIGIGLNVNETEFPSHIKNATSIKLATGIEKNLDELVEKLSLSVKKRITDLENGQSEKIYEEYHQHLYQKDKPNTFINHNTNQYFMGIIKGVSKNGNLQVQLEDDSITEFGIKEISFAKV